MIVREPLVRSSLPTTVVVSKPVLANGFAPQRIFAERSPGVVTVFSYFGGKPAGSSLEEGSGFVVDRAGIVLTAAHVIVSAERLDDALRAPARAVYVQFGDGDRVRAQIVGWDPYDDVGVLRVSPAAHALVPVPLGDSLGARGRSAGRGDRLAVRRRDLALGRRHLGSRPHDPLADDALQPLRRDPDRRPDQPGQLGRPAARRGRRRDRDQRPASLQPRLGLRGRRLRGADRLGQALARAAARLGPRRLRLPRAPDRGSDAGDREGVRLSGQARRARRARSPPAARPRAAGSVGARARSSGRTSG